MTVQMFHTVYLVVLFHLFSIGLCKEINSKPINQARYSFGKIRRSILAGFAGSLYLANQKQANAALGVKIGEFYQKWPYRSNSDFINYLEATSTEGDYDSVIQSMDNFATAYPMYKLTPRKASILADEVKSFKPKQLLELGTFFGYSSLYTIKAMPTDCTFTSIEGNSENFEVASYVIQRAFGKNNPILDRVQLINGLTTPVIKNLQYNGKNDDFVVKNMGLDTNNMGFPKNIDFLFLDHDKDCYLKDLLLLLEKQFINTERLEVIADNVIYPTVLSDFLGFINIDEQSIKNALNGKQTKNNSVVSKKSVTKQWVSRLECMPFERKGFETKFQEVPDAMSIALLS